MLALIPKATLVTHLLKNTKYQIVSVSENFYMLMIEEPIDPNEALLVNLLLGKHILSENTVRTFKPNR